MRPDGKTESLRQSMAWLHTWSGLLLGWLLYAVFFTGTLSFFRDEINDWMRPELHRSVPSPDAWQRLFDGMARIAPGASSWTLDLADSRHLAVWASWTRPGASGGRKAVQQADLDAGSGEVLHPRATSGGDFFYNFHFRLYGIPRGLGRWIVGLATMVMLVALVSGVITHKRIFVDFFTFRPRKGPRSWLDAHNALAVLALPFHLVMTFSGLLLLMSTLIPWGAQALFQGDSQRFRADLNRSNVTGHEIASARGDVALGQTAAYTPLGPLLAQANQAWPRGIGSIGLDQPGTAGALIVLRERAASRLTAPMTASRGLVFDAWTGQRVGQIDVAPRAPAEVFYQFMQAVHLGRFADPALRWLLFLSGVLGTLMAGTGLVLFVIKRRPDRMKKGYTPGGHRLVEVLNVAAIAGISVATAAYFWANRVIPGDAPQRAEAEIAVFFSAWAFCLLHATLRPHRRAWLEQLAFASAAILLLPILNWATGGTPLPQAIARGQWGLAGFDLAVIVIGSIHSYAAWAVYRHHSEPRVARAQA